MKIKFNGSHEGAEIRSKQKALTLEQQQIAVAGINHLIDTFGIGEDEGKTDEVLAIKNLQALIDDYQNACHARSYSGVKD